MVKEQAEPEIVQWVQETLASGRVPCLIRDMLLQNNYSLAAIESVMGSAYPPENEAMVPFHDYQAFANIALTRDSHPEFSDRIIRRVDNDKLQLYVIDDFLNDKECSELVDISLPIAEPSLLANGQPIQGRTSTSCYLKPEHGAIVGQIDAKIARLLGIQLGFAELIQAQFYEEKQEYVSHADVFGPKVLAEARRTLLHPGQRTWTCMVYLEVPEQGGNTRFVELDMEFEPKLGTAVAWNNLYRDGNINYDSRHQALPVVRGRKAVITKWFRDEGTGNVFF